MKKKFFLFTGNYWINLLIFLCSLLLTYITVEFAVRIYFSQPFFKLVDYRERTRDLYRLALPMQFDSLLGWIPEPGFSSRQTMWGTEVTILEDGIRSNDNHHLQLEESRPILVVGDSFTFGDQVTNNETWPAILERFVGKPVLNAGVFAYGIDQIFLRLKQLIPKYKPDTIIFSFIPQDIERCEHSTFMGGNKPYFRIENNSLILMNTPVEKSVIKPSKIRGVLGYSFLLHTVMDKLVPGWWLQEGDYYKLNENYRGHRCKEVTCLLFQELSSLVETYHIDHAYILVQDTSRPTTQYEDVNYALNCVDTSRIEIIDLRDDLSEIKIQDPSRYESYFDGHMTYEGNYFVAETIFKAMQKRPENKTKY